MGEWIWGEDTGSNRIAIASFLTFFGYFTLFFGFQREILHHPLFQSATEMQLPAFSPDVSSPTSDWTALPFFYTLGAWPKKFQGQAIFYGVPYEKGPPKNFVGHLAGRWKMPDILWIAEGPKTPLELSRSALKNCILSSALNLECASVREKSAAETHSRNGKNVTL